MIPRLPVFTLTTIIDSRGYTSFDKCHFKFGIDGVDPKIDWTRGEHVSTRPPRRLCYCHKNHTNISGRDFINLSLIYIRNDKLSYIFINISFILI